MRDKDLPDPAERFSEETLKKAEEMCSGLSLSLSIDKRGEASFYNGAVKALDTVAQREFLVTVCDVNGQPWYTLISSDPLPVSSQGLLVFKVALAEDRRFLGKLMEGRPGLREADAGDRYFTIFEPLEDARPR
ncbi:MAG: hypothetical protein V2J42_06775 [Wenzhouxiangella sp.]|jgi:hypothetical protein|nr:hypothetical protein [Wenzhouxiangella sp.]